MSRKSYKHAIRKLLACCVPAFLAFVPVKAIADDYVQMIQYELSFGGKQPESNLYMSMRPAGYSSQFDTDDLSAYRMPVISTNPSKPTLFKPLSMLYATEESASTEGNENQTPDPIASAGQAFGGLVIVALMLAPIAIGISDIAKFDPCAEGGCEIDIPDISNLPTVPVETGS